MRFLLLFFLLFAQPLFAAPKVVASIPPLAGIVAKLMQGVGTPVTLLPANAPPHGFALRPSQLAALNEADIVFAIGLDMEPWLARVADGPAPIWLGETLSEPLPARNFDLSARTASDPHIWLDPGETIAWVLEITQALIRLDRGNMATYRSNELALLREIVIAKERLQEIGARLAQDDIRLVAAHDAYQYLEQRLGVPISGMLNDIGGIKAGARSLARLSRLEGEICLIIDPNEPTPAGILPGATRIEIDPIGAALGEGVDFTRRFYGGIITALETCLTQP